MKTSKLNPPLAIITGASSGIGAAVARQLAGEGWRLALVGRNSQRLAKVCAECARIGVGTPIASTIDIRDRLAFANWVSSLPAPDLFIANAGILDGRRRADDIETVETALEVLDINLAGTIACVHAVLPGMRKRGTGHIAIVSSLAAFAPLADAPAYSASKAGLVAYAQALRECLRDDGLKVSVICPGYVATPMGEIHRGARPGELSSDAAAKRLVRTLLRRDGLSGFPLGLYYLSRLSTLLPSWLTRLVTAKLRFTIID